ncbi:MAG: DUF5134 domain-containing protein [Umezawaea sp.]
MIENLVLRWAMTLAFGWAGASHLKGLVAEGALAHRICEAAHGVMCAAMIAMAWPWGVHLPLWPQAGLFACAGAWFTAQALVIVLSGALPMRVATIPASHAVGMFSMVWMLVAMQRDAHDHTGHAAPDWPVGFPASLLGLLSVVIAGRWLVVAVAPGSDGRVVLNPDPAGHAVLGIGMATMLFSLR